MQEGSRKLAVCLATAVVIWHLPVPHGSVDSTAAFSSTWAPGSHSLESGWHVLAVFTATILAFILRVLPMGATVMLALVALAATKAISFEQAIAGFADETVWLVVAAFVVAGNVIRSGLGTRLALTLVVKLGRSPLGLAYALCASEMLLGALIPSNTARGGGVLAPIVKSLSLAFSAGPDATPKRPGAFLMLVGAHANLISSAMYLTGMAANPLVRRAALDVYGIDFGWGTWLLGACVPALLSFLLLPLLISRLEPPSVIDVTAARAAARAQLTLMGRWRRAEKTMACVGVALIVMWTTKALHGYNATLVAWMGVVVLLVMGTERWQDVLANTGAWDALVWVGGTLTMATQLRSLGIVGWFAHSVQEAVAGTSGLTAMVLLLLIYFYSMYGFSMLTAHIAAMVAAFLGIAKLGGVPALVATASMAYISNLCACLTPYSSGPVIVYFGQGYVSSHKWFGVGLVVSIAHLAVWLGAGAVWWKCLGWW